MSISLERSPDEILLLIVSDIEERISLRNLIVCSNRFRSLTLPQLYIHVSIVNEPADDSRRRPRDSTYPMLWKSGIASLVHSFTMRSGCDKRAAISAPAIKNSK